MKIYHAELNLKFQNNKLKIKYSYNENTKFGDLLEYVAFLYPNYNFCRCFAFYNNVNQINNEIKIKDYNLNEFLNIGNFNKDHKCYCKYKGYLKMSKFEIINKINNNNNDYYSIENPLGGANQLVNINQKEDLISLKKNISDLQNIIQQQKLKLQEYKNQVIDLKQKMIGNNTIHINENNNNINERNIANIKVFGKEEFENFYDVIIDIKSVKDINKGWKIKMNDRGLKNYGDHKTSKVIKIGVIGNSNKGKSFILSKISKINLPSGTSIRTEGLSVKYPELEGYKDRKIVLLDSAGLETPVLNVENIEKNKEKEMFKEKSREKLITELFLQNYIINTGDILIVVVGILTYSEQKLLNRIRTEIQRAKLKKTLYVIHNLITYTSVDQVQEYIKDYLLKSATFHLEKGEKVSTSENQDSGDYYYEKNSDPHIYHLIYANEGSEAGNYYNNYTLKIIENSYLNVTDLINFDIIESIKNRFIDVSKEIIENNNDNQLTIDDFCNNDNDNNKYIKLKDEKEITLKKCLIDELGFSNLKGNGFEPTYNFYKHKTENKIIIRLEAPGNSEIKSKIEYRGENTIIQLSGKKKKDKEPEKLEDNLFNSREFGDFTVDIPLKTEDYKVLNEEPAKKFVSGLFIFEYKLENNCLDSKMFKPEELV